MLIVSIFGRSVVTGATFRLSRWFREGGIPSSRGKAPVWTTHDTNEIEHIHTNYSTLYVCMCMCVCVCECMANNATYQSTEPLPCSNVVPVLQYQSQVTWQVRVRNEVVSCVGVCIARGCRTHPLHVCSYLVLVLKCSSMRTYESSTSIYTLEGGAWTLHCQQKCGMIETIHSWWAYESIPWILMSVLYFNIYVAIHVIKSI